MRRIYRKTVAFMHIFAIGALVCSGYAVAEEDGVCSFRATVLEVYESSILAVPYLDSEEYENSDRIYVGLSGLDEDLFATFMDEVEVNDSVEVEYNGVMLETYPVQIVASSIAIDELSETAELVKAQITGEGFLVESTRTAGGNYEADSSENLRILPSAWEDDPEGDLPDENDSATEMDTNATEYPSKEMEYLSTLGLVNVYHYADSETARQISECFDLDDPSEFSVQDGDVVNTIVIDYIAPIRLYLWENCIVLYCGTNETVQAVLNEALGEPFAANVF